jgi:hypothetical protein
MINGLKKWTSIALGVTALLFTSAQAHALAMLDFGVIAPTSGSISFAGGVAPLVGAGIDVDNVVGLPGGPVLTCLGCILNFTTGALTGTTGTSWDFGGGATSSISISGTVLNGMSVVASGALLTGSFGTATVTNFGGTFKIAGASFSDVKDPALLAFFGLPTGIPYDGNFNIAFQGAGNPPGAFASSLVLDGDIINTPNTPPVPEPGTMLLLGSGLAGFGYLKRRRRRPTA